ncbi:MAG: hypothetical protein K2X82_32785 [Gemmataceae bacterium]|nr:hypothetical protein [Gemmataceae bacterium]
MPPLTPDPVYDRLAQFTPASGLDPAGVLFAAGRASARTPRGWKLAVAGLVLTNLAAVGALVLRRPDPPAAPVFIPVPAVIPEPDPADEPPAESPAPGLLARGTNLDAWPRPATFDFPPDYPQTLAQARRAAVE